MPYNVEKEITVQKRWQPLSLTFLFLLLVGLAHLPHGVALAQQTALMVIINDLMPAESAGALPALVELADGGRGDTALDDLVLLFFNAETQTIVAVQPLTGYQTDEQGFLQLRAGADFDLTDDATGAPLPIDGVALATGTAAEFVAGALLHQVQVVDGILFTPNGGTVRSVAGDDPLQVRSLVGGTTPPVNATIPVVAAQATIPTTTLSVTTTVTEAQQAPATDQSTIPAVTPAADCTADITPIHEVQGADATSPLVNSVVTIEGIVVGDFQDTRTQLRGFFVQEELTDFDDEATTSEGIYVFDNGFRVDVSTGDLVQVRGKVIEYNTMTELTRVESVTICSSDNPVEPVVVTLPLASADEMEQYEGMLIRVEGDLQVAQNYFLGRYGQITIVAGGRAYQPTNLYPPDSAEAIDLAAANAARLLILDDGQDIRALGDNPNPVPYLGTPPDVVRAGDAITNVVGVIDFGRIDSAPANEVGLGYRLQPIATPSFTSLNPRGAPPVVGGDLKVTGFNVLNYFNGNGNGGGFPTSRGAKSAAEFERQRTKIIAALDTMNADVIGLMEIENDGYGPESAIQDLVDGLNDAKAAAGSDALYAFTNPGLDRLGADEITVGILYNTTTVTPTGSAATLATGAFDQELADFGRSRQPLAQTFTDGNGERFTLVVNHFKSKRPSGEPDEANIDSGNGVGAWNGRRTEAAQDLIGWLATDPTASGDPDFLVVGDLNAYAKEPPITTFEEAGYVNLIAHYGGAEAYSYVYDGQLGYLDHALASSTLVSQTTGAMDWHINADEAKVLDYDAQFNPPYLYSPDPFRASDHDSVLIGLTLTTANGEEPDGEEPDGEQPGGEEPDGEEPDGEEPLENAEFSYTVLPGETLSSIARRYSVTIDALAAANGLARWSTIYPNQQLTVPPVADAVSCVRTIYSETGESFAQLAERYGADPVRLAIANQLDTIDPPVDGKPICLPSIW
jgi:predicted extracellular nuclease